MEQTNSYYRARLKAFEIIQKRTTVDADSVLIRNGVMPAGLYNEMEKEIEKQKGLSNDPLTFSEITRYNTWFAMHPEKIAGIEIVSTSLMFPLRIKGSKLDVINTVSKILNDKPVQPMAANNKKLIVEKFGGSSTIELKVGSILSDIQMDSFGMLDNLVSAENYFNTEIKKLGKVGVILPQYAYVAKWKDEESYGMSPLTIYHVKPDGNIDKVFAVISKAQPASSIALKAKALKLKLKLLNTGLGNDKQIDLISVIDNVPVIQQQEVTAELLPEYLIKQRELNPDPQLTMLSFGGGQDSFAILYSLIYDKEFRKKYAPNDLVVAMSDTGNEFPYTYKAVKQAELICKQNNISFVFLTPDKGFHTAGWQSLKANMKRNNVIFGAAMARKSCTVSLKVDVINKYMYYYMCDLYGFPQQKNKKSWQLYNDKFNTPARVIIGFAKDEEKRALNSLKAHKFLPKWNIKHIQYSYPMIELGWNRKAAQDIISKYTNEIPPPSNCMICFYQSDQELIWLEKNYPDEFKEWVQMEKAKLDRFEGKTPKNYGVYGAITLTEKLKRAKAKYGHLSNNDLWEYKMSHGHCVKSAY